MIRFAADEDFDNDIIRGLRRRQPEINILRVQDGGLRSAKDAVVLAWAADEDRVLLTHDVTTMSAHAIDRLRLGQRMSGIIIVHQHLDIGNVIDDLEVIATCSSVTEWVDQVFYLPLR
jgi:predicted nuclease of predicted toxin-antitoxin system